jgi:exopolysaccharide production protein ExoQ
VVGLHGWRGYNRRVQESMTAMPVTLTRRRALLEINRDFLVCIFAIFLILPPTINWVSGRFDQTVYDSSGNTVWQVIEFLAFANCIVIAGLLGVKRSLFLYCIFPFVGMLIWIMLSVTWSEFPDLTIRRGGRVIIEVVAFVILALSFSSGQGVLRTLFRIFFAINLADIISIAVPTISQTDIGFAGLHGHKNLAGEFFYMALPVFLIAIFDRSVTRHRIVAIFSFLTAAAMLVVSDSKTAMGTVLIGSVFVVLSRIMFRRDGMVLACMTIFGAITGSLLVFQNGLLQGIYYFTEDPTLTGRDSIWRFVLDKFEGSPFAGVGYGALWQVGPQLEEALGRWDIAFEGINEAHNGYIDVLVQTGVIGLALLIICLIMHLARVYRYANSLEGRKRIGLADYAIYIFWGNLIYNVTESFFFLPVGTWFIFVFILSAVGGRIAHLTLARRELLRISRFADARPAVVN